jgi:hypothetical protein
VQARSAIAERVLGTPALALGLPAASAHATGAASTHSAGPGGVPKPIETGAQIDSPTRSSAGVDIACLLDFGARGAFQTSTAQAMAEP